MLRITLHLNGRQYRSEIAGRLRGGVFLLAGAGVPSGFRAPPIPEVAAVEEEEVAGDRLIPALQLVHIP